MNKHILLYLSFFFAVEYGYSQEYWSKRIDFNMGDHNGFQIIPLEDGYLVNMLSGCLWNHNAFCYSLIKFDLDGEKKWMVTMDSVGSNSPIAMAVRNDTIFYNTDYKINSDASVLMFDLQGNYLNRHDYTHLAVPGTLYARMMKIQSDRIFVNYSYNDANLQKIRDRTRVYDNAWNQLWEVEVPDDPEYNTVRNIDIDSSPDGGVIVACASSKAQTGACSIQKYSNKGIKEWATLLKPGTGISAEALSIHALPEGGFMGHWSLTYHSVFTNEMPDCWFRLDNMGQFVWQKVVDPYVTRNFTGTFIAKNGDLIGCGKGHDSPFDTIDEKYYHYAYIARVSPEGEFRWTRNIYELKDGGFSPWLQHGAELPNGDLIFTGFVTDTIQTPQSPSWNSLWLLKVDSNGCLTPGCDEKQYVLPVHDLSGQENIEALVAFPNPCSDQFTIAGILGKALPSGDYRYALYDALGNLVKAEVFNPTLFHEVDTRVLSPGSYSLVIFLNGRRVQVLKISRIGY